MGLLDSVLGSALGGMLGGQGQAQTQEQSQGGLNPALLAALVPVVLSMLKGGQQGGGASSGGLGDILGGLLGQGGQTDSAGGLGALLKQFQSAGLSQQASSWVGTGENQPISADDIGKVFGSGALAQIAQQAGVSHGEASSGLAALLPQIIDQLTPDGQVPQGEQLQAGLSDLLQKFARG